MGVRGSILERIFIVGAGAPGGVSTPWADVFARARLNSDNGTAIKRMLTGLGFGFIAQ